MDTAMLPPRVGLHLDGRTFPAIPVHLQGHEASLLFLFAPPAGRDVLLVLDWGDGATTELRARVRAVEEDCCLVDFDVHRVGGDWQPFVDYLGRQVRAA